MAPMVHWPEVMVTYDSTEKFLFSADGFGKFGALDAMKIGNVKQDVIISISVVNTEYRYRIS